MSAIFCLRLAFVALCVFALHLAARRHRALVALLREFFFAKTAPENLGLLRVAVFGAVLLEATRTKASWYAALPIDFRELPRGWPWLEDEVLPLVTRHVWGLEHALVVLAALAVLGALSRFTMPAAAALAVLVFAIPNFYFKVSHSMHVQVLCAAVLSASGAGDALSFDALLRRRRGMPPFQPSTAYAIPIRFCWLLIGTMYLFPGLWKLWESGDLWIDGMKLKVVMLQKWGETYDVVPRVRVDRHPLLLAFFGTATLVFEIGFLFALFHRTSRAIAAVAAAGFHVGVGLAMDIWFDFWWPLVVLVEFPEILRVGPLAPYGAALGGSPWPLGDGRGEAEPTARTGASAFVVGTTIFCAMSVAGLAPIDSWPIAVYPRFQSRPSEVPEEGYLFEYWKKGEDDELTLLQPDFRPLDDSAAVHRIMWKALEYQRAGYETAFQRRVQFLAALVKQNANLGEKPAKLVVYLTAFPLDLDRRKQTPKRREQVAEIEL